MSKAGNGLEGARVALRSILCHAIQINIRRDLLNRIAVIGRHSLGVDVGSELGFVLCWSRSLALELFSRSAHWTISWIFSSVNFSPLPIVRSKFRTIILNPSTSARRVSSGEGTDARFNCASNISRHHSPKVNPRAWANSSSCAYSSSVTLAPAERLREIAIIYLMTSLVN